MRTTEDNINNTISLLPLSKEELAVPEVLDVVSDFKKTEFYKNYVGQVFINPDIFCKDDILSPQDRIQNYPVYK